MMSLSAIRELSREVAEGAARKGKQPFVPYPEDLDAWRKRKSDIPIPNLGDHEPEGWKRLDEDDWFFVDKSGMGSEHEPALTFGQFMDKLAVYREQHPEYGYAIVEESQFQVYVAPFRPV